MPRHRTRSTQQEIADLEDAIYEVAARERPVTVRGVFYRVMSLGLVPKTEQGYRRVQNRVLRMRRAHDLPYGWISDGTRYSLKPDTFDGLHDCLTQTAQAYRRALWSDQGVHVEIWSEKDAISGVIYSVTAEFDVPLMIARGFPSETFLWSTGEAIRAEDVDLAVCYQLGDHDPSGVVAWEHTQRRLREFVPAYVDLVFERLAVTPEQIIDYGLPTRPTKKTTHGAHFEGESVEVDAMDSNVLRALVREAIESHIDQHALEITRVAEESERKVLQRMANRRRTR
ncbi:hypothetical protein [Mycobacterium scrofulaceum]|uniref:hypothetical protein n=1 Tax=Mycobacterium scrofulaceum TaxID=1783 RepID=UPI000A6E2D1F|nr:hypothetical protein [Mycobacterium scrofulaceum]